jgi:hypothetical protein
MSPKRQSTFTGRSQKAEGRDGAAMANPPPMSMICSPVSFAKIRYMFNLRLC